MGRIHPRRRGAFTLLELMVVVALVGVLSVIAVTTFLRYQLRAQTAEAKANLKAVAVAEESHFAEKGTYVSVAAATPPAIPNRRGVAWPGSPDFDRLGWEPDGQVRFQYKVSADDGGGSSGLLRYTAEAASDLDENGAAAFWGYVKPGPDGTGMDGTLPSTTCSGGGVHIHGSGADHLDTVGPCDAASGKSVF